MNSLKKINWTTYINILILALIYVLSVLIKSTSLVYTTNFILIGSLSFVILNRVRNSSNIIRRLKELHEVDFPIYKDISIMVLVNIIIEGNNGSPFKIEIVAKRSKEYFSKILDI